MRNRRCALRAVLILMLLAVPCGLVCTIRAESIPHNVVLAFVEMDAPFVGHAFREPALARFWELASQFDACRLGNREEDAAINCLRTVINGEDAMSVAGNASSLRESTLTGLLLGNRGSCAALVALAMVLDPMAWDAYVLRDHVLLRTRVEPTRYFELTAQGREISVRELRNRFGPQLDSGVVVDAPTFIGYYLDNLAVRLAADGRDDEAERLFRQNVKREPYEARLHLNYGTFLLERGRLDEARKQLKLAVRDAPKSADGWTNLGVAHARLGKIDRARDCFERALKLEPGNQTARTNLAAITSTTNGRTKPQ